MALRYSSLGRAVLIALLLGIQTTALLFLPGLVYGSNLTFGNTINLSGDQTASGFPEIAAVGNRVYVAWLNNTAGNSNVLFRASSNNGTSFGPVIKVTNGPTGNAGYPQIAAVGNNVYIAWQQNVTLTSSDIFFSASINNGTSFGSPINLSSDSVDSTVPRLASLANNVYVTWQTATNNPDVVLKVSTNRGVSFGSVVNLSNNGHGATVADMEQIAVSGKNVYVTWRDAPTSSSPALTFFTHSSNNGTSFTSLGSISSGQGDINEAIAASGNSVYVTWINDTAFTDNAMFAASTNNGVSFSPAVDLYKAQVIDLNPGVAASGNYVYVVWTNKTGTAFQPAKNILYKASINNGAAFGNIVNLSNTPTKISDYPVITASGSNVYVTWSEEDSSSKYDVYFISSNDYGSTFGNPLDLSPTSGNSLIPSPAISAAGSNAYVAWTDDTPANSNGDVLFRGTGSPPSIPDVAVTAMVLSKSLAYSGVNSNPITVNVTASNPGTVPETFFVTAYANNTILIGNQTVTGLSPGISRIVTFNWNTASVARGYYVLTAKASQVSGETNLSNNNLIYTGGFTIRLKGDANGDCRVDLSDLITVAAIFGKTSGSPGFNPAADLNNDGVIDLSDIILVAASVGQTC